MDELRAWGTLELNPLMWLTIWQRHITGYRTEVYVPKAVQTMAQPKPSTRYTWDDSDEHSPSKKNKDNQGKTEPPARTRR